ncbi:MAG TPA: ABC transporter permease subunit [Casimicrobiaceae bacterium]|nr:ABC transporter permease subunit [Casimicrobiaceae bacterium]
MLLSSRFGRWLAWALFIVLFVPIFGLPLMMVGAASVAGQWNDVLPSHLTLRHLADAVQSNAREELLTSLLTGLIASAIALLLGTWAALAVRGVRGRAGRAASTLFLLPIAVPSVSVGLGLLVAFSRPPLLLNGTAYIVLIAHVVLVTAFAYGSVAAGLSRLPPHFEQVAASLGARPAYVLFRVTLPLITPSLVAAAGLCFALSMGELGATIMVYPPDWTTLPIGIFALSDRGYVFDGAALTMLLLAVTLTVLIVVTRIRTRASFR